MLHNNIGATILSIEVESSTGVLIETFDSLSEYNQFVKNNDNSINWDEWFEYAITPQGALTPNQLSGNEPID